MGLLIGQSKDFFELLRDLAEMQARPDESATDLFVRILWKAPSQNRAASILFCRVQTVLQAQG